MALTAKPTKKVDLSKIDDIQNEFFGQELTTGTPAPPETISAQPEKSARADSPPPAVSQKAVPAGKSIISPEKPAAKRPAAVEKKAAGSVRESTEAQPREGTVADLLTASRFSGVRYTTRPYTVPRSLTIDLNRLKAMLRAREMQYTQAELMEKMIRESLEIVNEGNYYELRERAFGHLKSPDQCSRRSVTLTEDTFFRMSELKADLAQAHGRRFSNDELLTVLLAVAFAPLYEQGTL
jgi:hypothetical protein